MYQADHDRDLEDGADLASNVRGADLGLVVGDGAADDADGQPCEHPEPRAMSTTMNGSRLAGSEGSSTAGAFAEPSRTNATVNIKF